MIRQGQLRLRFLRNDHLRDAASVREPQCTHAQMVRYSDTAGRIVVEVFQYLRPDNTIGASGLADPKRLVIGNTEYIADPNLAA